MASKESSSIRIRVRATAVLKRNSWSWTLITRTRRAGTRICASDFVYVVEPGASASYKNTFSTASLALTGSRYAQHPWTGRRAEMLQAPHELSAGHYQSPMDASDRPFGLDALDTAWHCILRSRQRRAVHCSPVHAFSTSSGHLLACDSYLKGRAYVRFVFAIATL
eukprot:CAMPEP_0183375836 /NCGR_PEP_ID=MMETSP0164_2-20130417/118561_1 /TAXON_ID=221442 /ORGANISM="Coccolithus pelagicus ssp braarudi, Strain PLY182g" /LENGTH=165 /DNA_ID=CAMNT_0025553053 /DNA_START=162 /DNA_END=656 /DNA_ORIENTATION=-